MGKGYNKLRRSVWEANVKRKPMTSKVRGKSSQVYERKNSDGGEIDYHHYGGKKSSAQKYRDLMSGGSFANRKDKGKSQRGDWKGVAKELGIGNVNSKKEVLKMIDHVMGGGSRSSSSSSKSNRGRSNSKGPSDDYKPVGDPPSSGDNGGVSAPPTLEGPRFSGFTDDPSKDAIRHGDDMNDWYGSKFLNHLDAEAEFSTASIDNDMGFYLSKFAHEPPELGDASELFDKYSKKIKNA